MSLKSSILQHINEILNNLKQSDSFGRNVFYSFSGNTIVLVISFFLTPVIARIYGPIAYGDFALLTSVSSIIIPFATLQLQAGYVAAKNRAQFYTLVKLSFIALAIISILSVLGVLGYNKFAPSTMNSVLKMTPIYVFFSGLFAITRGWSIKTKEFKRAANAKVTSTILGKSTTLSFGLWIDKSALGIVTGSIVTFIIETWILLSKKIRLHINAIIRFKTPKQMYVSTIKEFRQYPTYITINNVINNLSTQLPIYFIALFFDKGKIGLFSLSVSLIQIPLNLSGTSIGAVFLPKIAEKINNKEVRNEIVLNLYAKLFYPGLIALIFLSLMLMFFLPLILGPDWAGAGKLGAIISISFVFSTISIPLSVVYRLIKIEHINFKITLIFIVLKTAGLYLGASLWGFEAAISLYFLVFLIHNATQVLLLIKKLEIKMNSMLRDLIVSMVIYFAYCFAIIS